MNRRYVLSLVGILTLAGCREVLPPPSLSPDGTQAMPVILFNDLTTLMISDDPVLVTRITVQGDHLLLNVQYSGGCQNHDFRMYANRRFIDREPPHAELYLSHDGHDDGCGLTINNVLTFDLVPLQDALREWGSMSDAVLLRIHEPGSADPLLPFARYDF